MQENSYIQVLIQSLHQKVEALDSIIEKNQEQYEILSAEEADMDAFEKNIDEKSTLHSNRFYGICGRNGI